MSDEPDAGLAKPEGALKRGWTTGACATAATKAALTALLTGHFPDPVSIRLPKGEEPSFPLASESLSGDVATAGIVKDAGDDPDVTHGLTIVATVKRGQPGSGIRFAAGEGVGMITRPGLPLPVGEPAINPVPRALMSAEVEALCAAHNIAPDIEITISVPGGEAVALKTWNPRLGITGGLSILGTTGIVHPFSCAAWIHSIHRGIDVARAAGLSRIAGSTGSTSEDCRPEASRPARNRPHRHGRFRRRHAQISARPSRATMSPSPAASPRSPSSPKARWTCIPRAARLT